ncbi:MAG: hypothetical protein JXQ72_02925 [Anaerolineae bacterium]|nr:hypothetical protein [Anaerolineae bacterium]
MRKFAYLTLIAALLLALVPSVAAQGGDDMMMGPDVIVTLEATPFAEGVGLASVTGWAHVTSDEASIHIVLEPNGAELPEGTVLEGWVVDAGLDGGPGETNVSDDDEAYGVSFGEPAFDAAVEAAPYALSTGILTETEDGTWEVEFQVPGYNFSPYDAVVITAESDGVTTNGFDPRPGTPVFAGGIADGQPADEVMMGEGDDMSDESMSDEDDDMMGEGDDMMMGSPVAVVLAPTPLAANAGLDGASGEATVYIESGEIEITVNLGGVVLTDGSVLEGWVVDAGLDGGPGSTNVTDEDEAYGVSFGEAAFDTLVESAPYALSTGVLHDNMDGTYSVSFHVPAYNFSPYDAVVITLESDGVTTNGFDPRPGTPVLAGAIEHMGM